MHFGCFDAIHLPENVERCTIVPTPCFRICDSRSISTGTHRGHRASRFPRRTCPAFACHCSPLLIVWTANTKPLETTACVFEVLLGGCAAVLVLLAMHREMLDGYLVFHPLRHRRGAQLLQTCESRACRRRLLRRARWHNQSRISRADKFQVSRKHTCKRLDAFRSAWSSRASSCSLCAHVEACYNQ